MQRHRNFIKQRIHCVRPKKQSMICIGQIADNPMFPFLLACPSSQSGSTRYDPFSSVVGGNPPVTGGFPSQRDSNAERVFMCWRHHEFPIQRYISVAVYTGDKELVDEEKSTENRFVCEMGELSRNFILVEYRTKTGLPSQLKVQHLAESNVAFKSIYQRKNSTFT